MRVPHRKKILQPTKNKEAGKILRKKSSLLHNLCSIKQNRYCENTYHLLFHWTHLLADVILPYRTPKNG